MVRTLARDSFLENRENHRFNTPRFVGPLGDWLRVVRLRGHRLPYTYLKEVGNGEGVADPYLVDLCSDRRQREMKIGLSLINSSNLW